MNNIRLPAINIAAFIFVTIALVLAVDAIVCRGADASVAATKADAKEILKIKPAWLKERLDNIAKSPVEGVSADEFKRAVYDKIHQQEQLDLKAMSSELLDYFNKLPKAEGAASEELQSAVATQIKLLMAAAADSLNAGIARDIEFEKEVEYVYNKPLHQYIFKKKDDQALKNRVKNSTHRTTFSLRVGYEKTNFPNNPDSMAGDASQPPEDNASNTWDTNEGGWVTGVRCYSEQTWRVPWIWPFQEGKPADTQDDTAVFHMRPRVGEVDTFYDLNYRTADVAIATKETDDTKDDMLVNIRGINLVGGVYWVLTAKPRAQLYSYERDGSRAWRQLRWELGVLAEAEGKAILNDTGRDFEFSAGAGFRFAHFMPEQPDPIRTFDILIGKRRGFDSPRFRMDINYLLYDMDSDSPGSTASFYGFANMEFDFKNNHQDAVAVGFYIKYPFDRIRQIVRDILR